MIALAELRKEMETLLHVTTRPVPPGWVRHAAMPEVRRIVIRAMDRAATAPVEELAVEALIRGLREVADLCLQRNGLQGTDLAGAYWIARDALAKHDAP